MGRDKKKPNSLKKKHASQEDIKPEDAAKALRDEIIEEVKLLAEGKIRSVYGLVGKGRELIELESGAWNKKPLDKPEAELTEADL